ncbi:T9SS type A sorting domain-containing protein [bacterium]|nr:T9SS type A sorting domain-containing protein [bacterium]
MKGKTLKSMVSGFLVLFITIVTFADWYPEGIQVNPTNGWNISGDYFCVPDGLNGFYAGWANSEREFPSSLQHIDSDGNLLWDYHGVPIVHPDTLDRQVLVGLEAISGIGCYTIYQQQHYNQSADYFVQRFDLNGYRQWGGHGIQITEGLEYNNEMRLEAHISILSDSSSLIFGYKLYSDDGIEDYCVAKIDSSGRVIWSDIVVREVYNEFDFQYPIMVSDKNGGAIVGWVRNDPELNNLNGLYLQRVSSEGEILWDARRDIFAWSQEGGRTFAPAIIATEWGGCKAIVPTTFENVLRAHYVFINNEGEALFNDPGNHILQVYEYENDVVAPAISLDGNDLYAFFLNRIFKLDRNGINQYEANGRIIDDCIEDNRFRLLDVSIDESTHFTFTRLDSDSSRPVVHRFSKDGDHPWSSCSLPVVVNPDNQFRNYEVPEIIDLGNGSHVLVYKVRVDHYIRLYSTVVFEDGSTPAFDRSTKITQNKILELPENPDLQVYPNPTNGRITLRMDFNVATSAVLTVYDIHGREISRKKLKSAILDQVGTAAVSLDGLASGIYFAKVSSTNAGITSRIQKFVLLP